jgi:hypothetical protein
MAYFPETIMPKILASETVREVDDSPAIYNAKDYNTHLRELIAIERFLVGDGLGASDSTGMIGMLNSLVQAFNNISKNGIISQSSGLVADDGTVPLPSSLVNTYTNGGVGAGDLSIPVVSVAGFPTSGYITKFNSIKTSPSGTPFGFKSLYSQEVIQYTSVDTNTNEFLGCTRAIIGSAQAVPSGIVGDVNPALIVAGRASIFLTHKGWDVPPNQIPATVYVDHDASLVVTSAVYDDSWNKIDGGCEVMYALTVSGTFEDIKVSESV